MQKSSRYFQDAIVAFEGGGVRGIAYAGACEAAESNGIQFRAALGTSVGSIAAALVAAGFRGQQLTAVLEKLPLESFLTIRARAPKWWQRLLAGFLSLFAEPGTQLLVYGHWALG